MSLADWVVCFLCARDDHERSMSASNLNFQLGVRVRLTVFDRGRLKSLRSAFEEKL